VEDDRVNLVRTGKLGAYVQLAPGLHDSPHTLRERAEIASKPCTPVA